MSCGDKGKVNGHAGQGNLMGLLTGPRRWWLFGAMGVVAGLVFGWEQLVLFGLAPILISLLPCLVMCALGLCMMKCKDKPGSVGVAEPAGEIDDALSSASRPYLPPGNSP